MVSKTKIRLFTDAPIQENTEVALNANQVNYLKNVMREKLSDPIIIFNGSDGEWRAEISLLQKKHGAVIALKQIQQQRTEPDIWLIFAPIKFGKIDYLVTKATELGVSALLPVFTQHTVVNRVNTERLKANVIEAAEQCERLSVPNIHEPETLEKILQNWPVGRNILFCDESGHGKPVGKTLSKVKKEDSNTSYAILIGPEGGFSKSELEKLHQLSYVIPIGLGPRILRADTAALAALTCWQEHLGDWDAAPSFIVES